MSAWPPGSQTTRYRNEAGDIARSVQRLVRVEVARVVLEVIGSYA